MSHLSTVPAADSMITDCTETIVLMVYKQDVALVIVHLTSITRETACLGTRGYFCQQEKLLGAHHTSQSTARKPIAG